MAVQKVTYWKGPGDTLQLPDSSPVPGATRQYKIFTKFGASGFIFLTSEINKINVLIEKGNESEGYPTPWAELFLPLCALQKEYSPIITYHCLLKTILFMCRKNFQYKWQKQSLDQQTKLWRKIFLYIQLYPLNHIRKGHS